MRRRAVCLTAWALGLMIANGPSASRASDRSAVFRQSPPQSFPRRAQTGSVVTLREQGSELVRFPALEIELGSTLPEVLEAAADCASQRLGQLCEMSFENEAPPRKVKVPAFYLSRTEVTVAEYRRCVEVGACTRPAFGGMSRFDRPELPVTFVDWEQARAYCKFRGMRLPREAEFERAARGASRRRYPWGQLWNNRAANHGRRGADPTDAGSDPTDATDGFLELAPVGSYPSGRTPEGVLDLAGNVAEWMEDPYTEVQGGPPLSGVRVVRGGDFRKPSPWLRPAARIPMNPASRVPHVGFRCAKSAPGAPAPAP